MHLRLFWKVTQNAIKTFLFSSQLMTKLKITQVDVSIMEMDEHSPNKRWTLSLPLSLHLSTEQHLHFLCCIFFCAQKSSLWTSSALVLASSLFSSLFTYFVSFSSPSWVCLLLHLPLSFSTPDSQYFFCKANTSIFVMGGCLMLSAAVN